MHRAGSDPTVIGEVAANPISRSVQATIDAAVSRSIAESPSAIDFDGAVRPQSAVERNR
jgi:hypothetical protein